MFQAFSVYRSSQILIVVVVVPLSFTAMVLVDVLGEYFADRGVVSIFFHLTQIVQCTSHTKLLPRSIQQNKVSLILVRKTSALLIIFQHFSMYMTKTLTLMPANALLMKTAQDNQSFLFCCCLHSCLSRSCFHWCLCSIEA